jgi:UDP-glucuronate decarboxylase
LAELVIEMIGSSSKIEQFPLPEDDPRQRQPDIRRARETLDWEPTIKLKDGLKKTIAHFEEMLKDGLLK